jgi:hypothetical protein
MNGGVSEDRQKVIVALVDIYQRGSRPCISLSQEVVSM